MEILGNRRFAFLSDEDMAKLSENSQNKNTTRSTNNRISVFQEWAKERGKMVTSRNVLVTNKKWIEHLLLFFGEIRKQNGNEYELDSLRLVRGAIQRYLVEKKCNINILSDFEFEESRRILEGKARLTKYLYRDSR